MSASPRALRFAFLLPLLALTLPADAQRAPQPQHASAPVSAVVPNTQPDSQKPWLYRGSDIPPDPDWKFGELPNGVRYAVRHNGVPPGQVSIRVRMDAGSLMERDSEQGFAHLIEHLSFRGSEYVPDGEAKRVWQRFGATFGSDSNAQTTPTMTTYKLDLPSATPEGLDESVKILSGMMEKPNIVPAALTAERPVVLAELREQPGPQVRLSDTRNTLFFAGQLLANRSPIGKVSILEAATAETVKAFHDRWYRPERALVVISGDGDPAVFEQLIAKHFSDWQGIGPKPQAPDFGKPVAGKPASAAIVEPQIPTLVSLAVLRPWTVGADTIAFNQNRLVDLLAIRILNRRLETRARAGGSFLSAQVDLDDIARSANATTVAVMPLGDDWESALRDVRAVLAEAQKRAPTQDEIDREVVEFDAAMKAAVDTERTEASASAADDIVQAVDIRETVAGAETSYGIFRGARDKKMFTPARLLASSRRIFRGTATRALVSTPKPAPMAAAQLATALKTDVSGLIGARTAQAAVSFDALPKLGTPAAVVSREPSGQGFERITFSNGVRMMLFANESESSKVYVRVRFGGGAAALPADTPNPAWAGGMALMESGIGSLGQEELDRLTNGRRINADFGVDDDAFLLAGLTSASDLPDELRLLATKLAAPGWDPNPVVRARAATLAGYDSLSISPDAVLSRDLEGLLRSGDTRYASPSREQIAALDPKTFRTFWEPLLATGPIEVQVFGDVKADAAIDAVARSFGALPPRTASAAAIVPVRFPAHVTTPVVRYHRGPDNQAAAVIAWPTGGGIADISESRRLDILAAIFTDRLFDRLRSEAGASYSPSVRSDWPVGLPGGGRLLAVGQVTPDKVNFFFKLAREIAADLVANPIGQDELKRTMVPMGQYIVRASSGNTFWLRQMAGGTYDPRRIEATMNLGKDFASITPQQLQQVAAKYLQPGTDWTLAVLPEKPAAK